MPTLGVGAEPGGAFERGGRRGVTASPPCILGGLCQRIRRLLVRAERRARQVPSARPRAATTRQAPPRERGARRADRKPAPVEDRLSAPAGAGTPGGPRRPGSGRHPRPARAPPAGRPKPARPATTTSASLELLTAATSRALWEPSGSASARRAKRALDAWTRLGSGSLERRGLRRAAPPRAGPAARAARAGCRAWPRTAGPATSGASVGGRSQAEQAGPPPREEGPTRAIDSMPGRLEAAAPRRRGPPKKSAMRSACRRLGGEQQRLLRLPDRATAHRRRGRRPGFASAAAASRLRVAAPTEKRSYSSPRRRCRAQTGAHGPGDPAARSKRSRIGQQTSSSPENSSWASDSTPISPDHRHARRRAWPRSPGALSCRCPASPRITRAPLLPMRCYGRAARRDERTRSQRPISTCQP